MKMLFNFYKYCDKENVMNKNILYNFDTLLKFKCLTEYMNKM